MPRHHRDRNGEAPEIDEAAAEGLRQGRAPDQRPDLNALAALCAELRAMHAAEPVPPMSAELAELVGSGRLADRSGAADKSGAAAGTGITEPVADPPVNRSRPSPSWRLKALVGAALAGVGLLGGLGAAGALPAPMQRLVAETADVVGLDFPRPPVSPVSERPTQAPVPDPGPPCLPAHSPSPSPSLTQPPVPPGPGATASTDRPCVTTSTTTLTAGAPTSTTGSTRQTTTTAPGPTATSTRATSPPRPTIPSTTITTTTSLTGTGTGTS